LPADQKGNVSMESLALSAASIMSALAAEIGHVFSPTWWQQHAVALFNILMIDLTLAGDNAVGSFLFAVGFMLFNWLLTWGCYKRGIIIKI